MEHANEEQEMEAEALQAIFDEQFEMSDGKWSIQIYPETGDEDEMEELNNVGCKLIVELPEAYPDDEGAIPMFQIEILKGLAEEHIELLKNLASEEAVANAGSPSIFAVAERLKEWLLDNNVKGLDDVSMHAQMMRKSQEAEAKKVRPNQRYSQSLSFSSYICIVSILSLFLAEGNGNCF